jgi:enoyl-CoA hydratase
MPAASAPVLSPAALAAVVAGDRLAEEHYPAAVVDLAEPGPVTTLLGSAPCVVIGIGSDPDTAPGPPAVDVVARADDELGAMLETIRAVPRAATSLAVLLRLTTAVDPALGLAAESAVYSALQGGPEFARWRDQHPGRAVDERDRGHPPVAVSRLDGLMRVTLDRPWKHNAFSSTMRDGLTEVLSVALVDDTIEQIVLDGRGPSFCSGGDLDEFGTFPDPATAHVTRLARSPARMLWLLRDRVEVRLHGSCLGAGIELAAFACRVVASADARIGLPELRLGLVPGAGGTVSLPRRIGRHRTAWLGLTARTINAATALRWGLVDAVTGP